MKKIEELLDRARRVLAITKGPLDFGIIVTAQGNFRVQAENGQPTDEFPTLRAALRQFMARLMTEAGERKRTHDEESTRLAVGAAELEQIEKEVRDE